MNRFHIDTCPKIPNWECEWVTECAAGCISKQCTYDLAQTLQSHRLQNLVNDNVSRYNRPCGAEAHLARMNPFDEVGPKEFGLIVGTELRLHKQNLGKRWTTDLVKMLTKEGDEFGRIVPYNYTDKNPKRKRNLRNSEFNNSDISPRRVCSTIGGIISKLDTRNFPVVANNYLSDIGTDMHFLINQQHVRNYLHNSTLKHVGVRAIPRTDWCERDTLFLEEINGKEYVVGGKADMVTRLENVSEIFLQEYKKNVLEPMGISRLELSENLLCVFDIKRGMYGADETRSHLLQIMSNIWGIEPGFQIALAGTIKSPFTKEKKGRPKSQKYHLNIVTRDGPIFEKFKKEIVTRYASQARALENRDFYLNWVDSCKKKDYCLNKEYCKFLYNEIKSQHKKPYDLIHSMELILPDVDLPKQD